jgi:hypothetical protein
MGWRHKWTHDLSLRSCCKMHSAVSSGEGFPPKTSLRYQYLLSEQKHLKPMENRTKLMTEKNGGEDIWATSYPVRCHSFDCACIPFARSASAPDAVGALVVAALRVRLRVAVHFAIRPRGTRCRGARCSHGAVLTRRELAFFPSQQRAMLQRPSLLLADSRFHVPSP